MKTDAELLKIYGSVFKQLPRKAMAELATAILTDPHTRATQPLAMAAVAVTAFNRIDNVPEEGRPVKGERGPRADLEIRDEIADTAVAHVREGGTPFAYQSAIIVDCTCGAEFVVPSGGDEYGTMELAHRNHVNGVMFEPRENGETYWLQTGEGPHSQVSLRQFIQAERGAGFLPKGGNGPATGGFSSGALTGTMQHPALVLRLWNERNGNKEDADG
jgi:hypothetical protein